MATESTRAMRGAREPQFWAWAEALELLRNAERLRSRFFDLESPHPVPCWEPPVDLYEQGNELRLVVALPGVSAHQTEVVIEESGLIVRGERPLPPVIHRAAIHRLEIPYGRFERRISLPKGNFCLQKQFFEDGCLVLVLRYLK